MNHKWMIVAALVGALGCGDDASSRWDEPLSLVGPIETVNGLAYIERSTSRVYTLDANRDGEKAILDIKTATIGKQPGASAASADGKSIFVVDEDREVLQIIDATDPSNIEEIELSGDFDRITVDPYGEYVILSFSGASDENVVARNLNEIGVINLQGTKSATFTTLSTRANSFAFTKPFDLSGSAQRVMAVLSDNEVTIFDLLADNDEDRLREVPLTVSEADALLVPQQVIFDTSKEDKLDLYIRTQNSDISRVTVRLAPDGASRKLQLSTDKLTVDRPAAMEVLTLSNGSTRLLTIAQNAARFTLVDTVSDVSVTLALPINNPAAFLVPFVTTVEEDGTLREEVRVIAYSPESSLVAVIRPELVPIEGDEPTVGRSVEAIRLDNLPERIEMSTSVPDQAIVFHPRSGFSLLNLQKNNDVPIQGGALRDVLFDGTFAYVVFQTLPNLTIFGNDGHPTNFDLPRNGTSVHFDQDSEVLIVPHSSNTGEFTVLNANDPRPENATVYQNVFLNDFFGREN
ncbi:MAG: hypothetical protein R3E66_12850 [bacterium]